MNNKPRPISCSSIHGFDVFIHDFGVPIHGFNSSIRRYCPSFRRFDGAIRGYGECIYLKVLFITMVIIKKTMHSFMHSR